jgi:uncharacterized membrane protein
MTAAYNDFSGQNAERVRALSDGVFAVAMTLLVLEIRLPLSEGGLTNHELWSELVDLGPRLAAYLLSFTMLGTFWLAQHTLLGLTDRSNRSLSWANLFFLLFVTTLPFTASVLAEHPHLSLAVGVYWLNLALLGLTLAGCVWRTARGGLVPEGHRDQLAIFGRRIALAQGLYAAAALLALVSPPTSIAALAVVQLFFVVAPRLGRVA